VRGPKLRAVPVVAAFLAITWLTPLALAAADRPPITITDPSANKYRAAVLRFAAAAPEAAALADEVRADLEAGLLFSGLFEMIDPSAFLEPLTSRPLDEGPMVVCPNWRQIRADALVQGEISMTPTQVRVEFRVLDVSRSCLNLARKVYRVSAGEQRRIGKAVADDVVAAFTGVKGVSDTEIAFVSDRTGDKEIHVMDADGGSLRRATTHRSLNMFPDWSPDGTSIVYTSYRHQSRPFLYMLTRGKRSPGRILRELNGNPQYRAVFDPSGDRLALVMSIDGATEIFSVGRGGRNLLRLTRTRSIEVSPTWSPDGSQLAFVSDRAGAPQIYVMDADGGNVRRLTFNGGYNASPAWSPDGKWIAYESRVGGQMDIWLIDPSGEVNLPLIEHPRTDEHPSWSPDGRMLAFSSARRGDSDIYVVDVNGRNLRKITADRGEDTVPAWGPRRR
jgi:TolB protein